MCTKYAVKIYSTRTEYAVKYFPHVLSMRYKNLLFLEFLNIHKRPKTLKKFQKTLVGIHMGPKTTTNNL
jgi:hypothetical protein